MNRILEKLPIHPVINFLNSRNPREKQMILVMGLCGILAVDYLILIRPITSFFSQGMSKSSMIAQEVKDLETDQKNKALITKALQDAKERLAKTESRFVTSGELPVLLENLSKLASESGVRISSLQPMEAAPEESAKRYALVPIRVQALAGTHELGGFLSRLESDAIFFHVANLKISENPAHNRKHLVELQIAVYRKGAA